MSAYFNEVPILEVNSDNIIKIWPVLSNAIKNATFVAMDAELSGLGDRRKINLRDINQRYEAMTEVAQTRSVISLGISCYKLLSLDSNESAAESNETKTLCFSVQTFNIFTLCKQDYVVEPASLKFLRNHGFDFNKQYSKGLSYTRGCDQDETSFYSVRNIFSLLISSSIPIVLHNAFVDLVFFYQNFYADLPGKLSTFVNDMSEMFVNGIYDTKFICEYKNRMNASFLEYIFRKSQRDNAKQKENCHRHARIIFPNYPKNFSIISYLSCGLTDDHEDKLKENLCEHYSAHGWCQNTEGCPDSHDIDRILDSELKNSTKKRKKRQKFNGASKDNNNCDITDDLSNNTIFDSSCERNSQNDDTNAMLTETSVDEDFKFETDDKNAMLTETIFDESTKSESTRPNRACGHRAGFDAFMTGFVYACYLSQFGAYKNFVSATCLADLDNTGVKNKVYLCGKDLPLQIVQSSFSKTSKLHKNKIQKLRKV